MRTIISTLVIMIFSIIVILGCDEGTETIYQKKPSPFSFTIEEPSNNQIVEKLTKVVVKGECNQNAYTQDIFLYPLVMSPGGNYYPYYRFSIHNGKWDTSVFLGDSANISGDLFHVVICAIYKKDTLLFENAHVPDRSKISHIGSEIPEFCTELDRITLKIK